VKPLSSFPLLEGELQTAEAINPRVTRGGHSPRAALSARVPDASNSTQSGAATTRIFVVDDHPFFRDGLLAWIARQPGFVSSGYADSPALASAAIAIGKPDLVLLDLHLRDGDGLQVIGTSLKMDRPPKFIILSNRNEAHLAQRALRAGASGYVSKVETSDVLLSAIQTVLAGGIHLGPSLQHELSTPVSSVLDGPVGKLRDLCNRELQVLQLLSAGRTTKEIAQELTISPKTVEYYRESLKRKLGVSDSLTLVRIATIWGLEGRLLP